jgi:HAD superfamily hydrolase (TIGR01509 family)
LARSIERRTLSTGTGVRLAERFSNVKGVIFDMDGTLVDSEINTGLAVEQLLKESIPKTDLTGLDPTLGYGKTWALIVDELFALYPDFKHAIGGDKKDEAMKRLQHHFHHAPTPPPISKAVWAVEQAHRVMGKTGIATSSNQESMQHIVDLLGIRSKLTVAIAAENYQRSKPDPDPYLTAAQLLEVDPSTCLVFEDSIPGIKAGKAAGAKVIAILERSPNAELAKSLADGAITNYAELPDDFFQQISL